MPRNRNPTRNSPACRKSRPRRFLEESMLGTHVLTRIMTKTLCNKPEAVFLAMYPADNFVDKHSHATNNPRLQTSAIAKTLMTGRRRRDILREIAITTSSSGGFDNHCTLKYLNLSDVSLLQENPSSSTFRASYSYLFEGCLNGAAWIL